MIPLDTREVDTDLEGLETQQYTIEASPEAFKVLFDTIYTNKIRAVIREVWANAWDSHVEAGNPAPFDCHLPTVLEPFFQVRDYGVSLTHEEVMYLYSTMFASKKRETNQQTGMIGIGSKSPFAYTDTFTVVAYLDGERRSYLATIESSGKPSISLFDRSETDEPNGLEVQFPVQSHHYNDFASEASRCAIGYDVVPNMTGAPLNNEVQVVFEHNGYKVINRSGIFVRQGCVVYDVDAYDIEMSTPFRSNKGLLVDVPLGTLGVAASREHLSLDDTTKATVKELVINGFETIREGLVQNVIDAPTRLEAAKALHKARSIHLNIGPVHRQGKQVFTTITLTPAPPSMPPISVKRANDGTPVSTGGWEVQYLRDLRFIVDRGEKMVRKKTRIKLENRRNGDLGLSTYILTNPSPKQVARLVRLLGLEKHQVVSVTSLPDPGPAKRSGTSKGVQGVYIANGLGDLKRVTFDPQGKFYWVGIPRGNVPHFILNGAPRDDVRWWFHDALKTLGYNKDDIYFLTPRATERLKDSGISLDAELAQYVETNREHLEDISLTSAMISHLGVDNAERFGYTYAGHRGLTQLYSTYTGVTTRSLWEKAAEKAKAIIEKYPLLFSSANDEAIREYIEFIDSKEEI